MSNWGRGGCKSEKEVSLVQRGSEAEPIVQKRTFLEDHGKKKEYRESGGPVKNSYPYVVGGVSIYFHMHESSELRSIRR